MIKDVKVVPLTAHVDDRGYLIEILRCTDEHFTQFGQVYVVGDVGPSGPFTNTKNYGIGFLSAMGRPSSRCGMTGPRAQLTEKCRPSSQGKEIPL